MATKLYDKYLHSWQVDLYEQTETDIEDVQLIKYLISTRKRQCIFEVCCGSGRILVPLAKAGHIMTGLDMDNLMLSKLLEKAHGLENITINQGDAVNGNWGKGYDIVILAGNILLNIVSDGDIKAAQQKFIQKAYSVLKPGGYMFLDTNSFAHPEKVFGQPGERVIFDGVDSQGTFGRYILTDENYNAQKQVISGIRRFILTTRTGETFCKEENYIKHVPTVQQMEQWIIDAGFVIEQRYGNYIGDSISETTHRAIYWAKK